MWEQGGERNPWSNWQGTDIVLGLMSAVSVLLEREIKYAYSRRSDATEGIFGRCAQIVQDLVQLIDVADRGVRLSLIASGQHNSLSALENRLASQEFSKNASQTPHIDRHMVIHTKNDLG